MGEGGVSWFLQFETVKTFLCCYQVASYSTSTVAPTTTFINLTPCSVRLSVILHLYIYFPSYHTTRTILQKPLFFVTRHLSFWLEPKTQLIEYVCVCLDLNTAV